jgi:hypothetical protein
VENVEVESEVVVAYFVGYKQMSGARKTAAEVGDKHQVASGQEDIAEQEDIAGQEDTAVVDYMHLVEYATKEDHAEG